MILATLLYCRENETLFVFSNFMSGDETERGEVRQKASFHLIFLSTNDERRMIDDDVECGQCVMCGMY